MSSPLRVVLDVNVFVRIVKGKLERRNGTAVQRIFQALAAGHACGRAVQIVVSHRMLDTLAEVLQRLSVPQEEAERMASTVVDVMKAGPEQLDPHLILGGTPDLTVKDVEDGDVLATAFAARAHVLVTDNLADFAPPGCETYETTRIRQSDGSERRLTCTILGRPGGFEVVVAHPIDFAHWSDAAFDPAPDHVRKRFGSKPEQS